MGKNKILIEGVLPGSIAEELGIIKGDKLIKINGEYVEDILEYKFLVCDDFVNVEIEKQNEEIWEYEIDKDWDEDLGLIFDGIIAKHKTCSNKCIFCFIDQLPVGMRKTLYIKDDDTRLSFLMGNFVTLTNLNEKDIDKIIRYRISPINISVHSTNLSLRKQMLRNKNAVKLLEYLEKLKKGNITMKTQVVLCPGINDGIELDKTVMDLYNFYPQLSCIAVVPVGLTKFRDGLYHLREYNKPDALKVIEQVEKMQNYFLKKIGTRLVFLSDEFYIIALKKLPTYNSYESFDQLENGVGLIKLFEKELQDSLKRVKHVDFSPRSVTIVTGIYGEPYLKKAAMMIMKKYNNIKINVVGIFNEYFGTSIKVAGLVTGSDMILQLKDKNINKNVFIPENMLKNKENIFLDDLTVEHVEKALDIKIKICKQDGSDLLNNLFENTY